MNAPFAVPIDGPALPDAIDTRSPAEIFSGHCEARATRIADGILSVCEATDELQAYAKLSGLLDTIGQDQVQDIMSRAFMTAEMLLTDEIAGDSETTRAADLVRQWELADPRDRWKHTGEAPPSVSVRNSDIEAKPAAPNYYRTSQSVTDAFFYVTRTRDAAGIAEWLADHPRDEKYLLKLWEQKCSTAAATAT